jgi:hypothetical protein
MTKNEKINLIGTTLSVIWFILEKNQNRIDFEIAEILNIEQLESIRIEIWDLIENLEKELCF